MLTKSERMHIDTADNVPMACEATFSARPISSLGLVFMPTCRTLATCASFGASEAHDVGLFGFMREVVDILAILPQGHPLVVVTTRMAVTDAMRIPNEERANILFLAEVDHFAGSFVTQITNAAFCSCLDLVLGSLQLSPSSRVFFASRLLFSKLAKLLGSLPLERADATTCHDQGLSRVRRDSCQVDFTQVNRCMNQSWCFFGFMRLNTDMQLKAVVPNKTASPTVFRQVKSQNKRVTAFAHGKDNPSIFMTYSLSRPLDRIEAFFSPGIFHLHLGMGLAEFACGINVGKEGMDDHLHRLAMQSKLSTFGCLLQLIAPRPFGMVHSGLLVDLDTEVPDFGGLHLSLSQTSKEHWRGRQAVNLYRVHYLTHQIFAPFAVLFGCAGIPLQQDDALSPRDFRQSWPQPSAKASGSSSRPCLSCFGLHGVFLAEMLHAVKRKGGALIPIREKRMGLLAPFLLILLYNAEPMYTSLDALWLL
jgi:hypothetical protein